MLTDLSDENNTILTRTKEKQVMVSAVLDSLSSLLPSETYLRSNINTGLGFCIGKSHRLDDIERLATFNFCLIHFLDAECVIDNKCNPIPVVDTEKSVNKIR